MKTTTSARMIVLYFLVFSLVVFVTLNCFAVTQLSTLKSNALFLHMFRGYIEISFLARKYFSHSFSIPKTLCKVEILC